MIEKQPLQPGRELAAGSAWMIAMRWAIRSVGLLSTVILARLLSPDDFGVVAMAMVAVAMLQVFAQSGVDLALLRSEAPQREHYDAAWSLEIIQGVVLAIALFVSAPLVSGKFSDPRVDEVIRVLALAALIGGFQNIGVVNFRRNLDFRREFQFGVYKKLATFMVTVVAALMLRNYWALVVGQVTGRFVEVIVSYRMSDYRPRWSLVRVRDIWHFSRWLILSRFTMLLNRQFDRWVVGAVGGTAAMGNYFIAQDFASSPSDEVVAPMSRAAFPVYSRLRDDPDALADALRRMLSSVTAITFATGMGMAAVASDFVNVVLGAKWVDAIPLMPWLGLFAAVYGVVRTLDMFLIATGGERATSLMALGYAICIVPLLWWAGQASSVVGVAATKAACVFFLVFALARVVTRLTRVQASVLWTAVWPPVVAALAMYIGVKLLQSSLVQSSHMVGLLRDVTAGAAIYVTVSTGLWFARGRPDGIEQDLLYAMRGVWRRVRARQ